MGEDSKRLDLAQRVAARLRSSGGGAPEGLVTNTPPAENSAMRMPAGDRANPVSPAAWPSVAQPPKPARPPMPAADPDDPRYVQLDQRRLYSEGYVVVDGASNRIAEEFRAIKRPLLLNAFPRSGKTDPKSHVIMITSAHPGEGKTFTAINLSLSIATEPDLNVLLIDTDSHNHDMETRLGIGDRPGMLDVLADPSLQISDVILRTSIPNLSIIPCGHRHAMETELVASQRMAELVEDIAKRYSDRVIIFDTVPALASSVAGVLALHAGQVVLVVEAGVTQQQAVEEAVALVSGCKSISLMLNKSDEPDSSYGYYGYYGKYEKQAKAN